MLDIIGMVRNKRQEFECGRPFPFLVKRPPPSGWAKTEQQTERHDEGERSKAHLLVGGRLRQRGRLGTWMSHNL